MKAINVSTLTAGDVLRANKDIPHYRIKAGDIVRVIGCGYSRWDRCHYADARTADGAVLDVATYFMDFEKIS